MLKYVLTAGAGWLAAIALALGALLPYLLRPTPISNISGLELTSSRPYLTRMWPHYWIGYVVAGVSTLHASLPMAGAQSQLHQEGLWLATVALGLLWVQVWCGLMLRGHLSRSLRIGLRRFHFWSMFIMVALIALHIRINR